MDVEIFQTWRPEIKSRKWNLKNFNSKLIWNNNHKVFDKLEKFLGI